MALKATPSAGTTVKDIHYSLTGAQSDSSVAAGATVSFKVAQEGTTTLTFFAVDAGNNQDADLPAG